MSVLPFQLGDAHLGRKGYLGACLFAADWREGAGNGDAELAQESPSRSWLQLCQHCQFYHVPFHISARPLQPTAQARALAVTEKQAKLLAPLCAEETLQTWPESSMETTKPEKEPSIHHHYYFLISCFLSQSSHFCALSYDSGNVWGWQHC